MQSRDRVIYLASLSLFLSSLELFIPKPLPFFRLGLANIAVMMGLTLGFRPFLLLLLLKAICTSCISGTLFSVFLLMSLLQTAASGLLMYGLKRVCGSNISIYALSSAGAAASSAAQIAFAMLYAGRGALSFLPLLLAISLPASIATAYISKKIREPEALPLHKAPSDRPTSKWQALPAAVSLGAIMMTSGLLPSAITFLLACILQSASGRKLRFGGYAAAIAFMTLSSVLTPEGRILLSIAGLPVTEGALMSGLAGGFRLSAAVAFSLSVSSMDIWGSGIVSEVTGLSAAMVASFRKTEGNLFARVQETLSLSAYDNAAERRVNIPVFTLFWHSALFVVIMIVSRVDIPI